MVKKVLLIDDDSDDRVLFHEAILEVSPGTICATESDSQKALDDLYNSLIQRPDVIFLDINMPRISGWDCLERIKREESTKDIPVIMFSTSSHQQDVERACQSGAACLITKPCDYEELKECLYNVVNSVHEKAFFVYP